MHWKRKWQPTPVLLPGESQDGGAWWAAVYGVAQSRTRLKRLSSSSSLFPHQVATMAATVCVLAAAQREESLQELSVQAGTSPVQQSSDVSFADSGLCLQSPGWATTRLVGL